MSDELKPCPFCGVKPMRHEDDNHSTALEIECVNEICPTKPSLWGKTEAEAIAAWNTRHTPKGNPDE